MNEKQLQRFESKIEKTDSCWLWAGTVLANGYGQFWINDGQALAHRTAYEVYIGEIPDGLLVCHSCDVRNCVNPAHLWVGTQSDNRNDMYSKGRGNINVSAAHAKLKEKAASRTHCQKGHEWKIGVRQCQTCSRERKKTYRAKIKAERETK
jgi:hypothetical protein